MKLRILTILVALLLSTGTASALSSIEYSIQGDNAVVSVDMSYRSVMENETILGSQSMRFDYMDIDNTGIISEDSDGIILNNTLKAIPVQRRMISSGAVMQNFVSAIRTNDSYDLGATGFRADGRRMELASDVQAETTSLSHIVKGKVTGNVGMGLITQTPTTRFENIVRSRAVHQDIVMNANWQTYQPAVEAEVPSSDISSLCAWATESSYPVFPILA